MKQSAIIIVSLHNRLEYFGYQTITDTCTITNNTQLYCSVPGKRPWALKHNSQFWSAWALTQDQNSIRLYRSCYSGPLKCGTCTWALTWEWALPGTLYTDHNINLSYYKFCTSKTGHHEHSGAALIQRSHRFNDALLHTESTWPARVKVLLEYYK